MDEKWNVLNRKRGYLKIHVAVNIKTKEILALEVTDEKVHDGKVMKNLVEGVLNNNHNIKIKSFIGDGAYDSNENFTYLQKKRIQPIIKVKRNSIISSKNNKIRNREVKFQTKDYHKWKKKRKYGQRWMVETAFSSIKRMFGEYASATRFQNMVKEMTMKDSCTTYLEELHKMNQNNLRKTSYATEQFNVLFFKLFWIIASFI